MTDKQLRKLKRSELLELMIAQEKEIRALREELDAANARLQEREIVLREAGSIAEASLRLNHVFEAAQAAANQYLQNVRSLSRREEL
ncbi:MAG: DNA repair protein [Oscillospiraceae bacterium]